MALGLFGAAPADARTIAAPAPKPLLTAVGTGAVSGLALGGDAVFVTGQGAQAIDASTLEDGLPRWTYKTPTGDTQDRGGDVERVQVSAAGDLTGDGISDLALGTSQALRAVDGETGEELWRAENPEWYGGVNALALADFDGDGAQDVAFAVPGSMEVQALDGRSGTELWSYTRSTPLAVTGMDAADVNGDGATDVLVRGTAEPAVLFSDLQVISGLGAADTGTATPLWSASTGDPVAVAVGQVTAGGAPEVATVGYQGQVRVLDGTTGLPSASWTVAGRGADVAIAEIDGDAGGEVVVAAGHNDDNGDSRLLAAYDPVTAAAGPLWSYDPPQPPTTIRALGDDLVVAGGYYQFRGREDEGDGFVAAVDLATGTERWVRRTPERIGHLAVGPAIGGADIVAGNETDGGVHGYDAAGTPRWRHLTGGLVRAIAHADVDGDGSTDIVTGTDDAELIARRQDGTRVFDLRVPGKGAPDVYAVAAGDLAGDDRAEVVAGTFEFARSAPGGQVRAYDPTGKPLWTLPREGNVANLLIADLDGDGPSVLAASAGVGLSGDGAQLARIAPDGTPVWDIALPASFIDVPLAVADLDGDDTLDLVVGAFPFGPAVVLGIDGATGERLWTRSFDRIGQWLDTTPGGLSAFGDMEGRVALIERNGTVRWRTQGNGMGQASRGGSLTVDADGDGIRDVVHSADDRKVHMLSGADGHELWATPFGFGDEEWGGPVDTVRSDGADVVVAGAFSSVLGRREALDVYDPASGERIGRVPTLFHVYSIEGADLDGDGDEEALAGSGWQLHVVDPDGDRMAPAVEDAGAVETRRSNAFSLTFAPSGGQETPLAAAHVRVCGEQKCEPSSRIALAPGQREIGGLRVPGEGEWTMRLWLEDAAGNADPALASEPVAKVLDETAPELTLARPADDRSRTVVLRATDALSGIEQVQVERAEGDGWTALDVREAAGAYEADLPGDGRFTLRAEATDAAGNTTRLEPVEVRAGADPPGDDAPATADPKQDTTAKQDTTTTQTPTGTPAPASPAPPRCATPRATRRGRGLALRPGAGRVVIRMRPGRRAVLERRTRCGSWARVRRARAGRSYRVAPGTYRLRSRALRGPAVTVR